jgi:ABC-type nitrate/sulfonate/bicarbonate transport system ATPase subunit
MNDNPLQLDNVSFGFGSIAVFENVSLAVARGEFVAVVGPSGCGKTTLLDLFSQFREPTSGTLQCTGSVRMVYQHDSLFPWQTVSQNIALGLSHVTDAGEQRRRVGEMLSLINLEQFGDTYPHQLSGGMRRRVELARALAGDSDILLLDEPFSALDYLTRLRLRNELSRMLEEFPRTTVLVTHDIEEAAQLADRVLVFSERPARICCEVTLDLKRPRELTHPQVVQTVHRILAELGLEHQDRRLAVLA